MARGARRGANAPSRHRSPLLQVPRALTQAGDRPGGGHPRRNKDGDCRTSAHNAFAVIRTATQPAQRRRLSPEPQVPRALIWRGRDGSQSTRRSLLITPGLKARRQERPGQFHFEADTVSPRGTMNPDFPGRRDRGTQGGSTPLFGEFPHWLLWAP